MQQFTDLDKNNLRQLFSLYDFAKVIKVDEIIQRAQSSSQSPDMLFDKLYQQYEIVKFAEREQLFQEMHEAVPSASQEQIKSVIREIEMKKLCRSDAFYTLRRQVNKAINNTKYMFNKQSNLLGMQLKNKRQQQQLLQSQLSKFQPVQTIQCQQRRMSKQQQNRKANTSQLNQQCYDEKTATWQSTQQIYGTSGSKSKQCSQTYMDEIAARDVQDWVADVIGDKYNNDVRAATNSSTAFVDTLRSGVVLQILLQKLHNPPCTDEQIIVPKRSKGFFARDNVSVFLNQLHERYHLHEAQLFTDSDLCDGKNDRQVITCLLSLARAAYAQGDTTHLPRLIALEKQIDKNKIQITNQQLDEIVAQAEAEAIVQQAPQHEMKQKTRVEEVAAIDLSKSDNIIIANEEDETHVRNSNNNNNSKSSSGFNITISAKMQNGVSQNDICNVNQQNSAVISLMAQQLQKQQTVSAEQDKRVLQKQQLQKEENSNDIVSQKRSEEIIVIKQPCNIKVKIMTNDDSNCSKDKLTQQTDSQVYQTSYDDNNNSNSNNNSEKLKNKTDNINRVFYIRGNRITRDKALADNNNSKNVHHTQKQCTHSMVHPYSVTKPCPYHMQSYKVTAQDSLAPRYHSRHWDAIDCLLGVVLNAHYTRFPKSPWRFRALFSQPGEYVIYNRRSANKQVVHIRVIHDRLLIHRPQQAINTAHFVYHWVELSEALEQMEHE